MPAAADVGYTSDWQVYSPVAPQTVRTSAPERSAGFDAVKHTRENRRHWLDADDLGPVASLTPEVRRTLRMRSRYECLNNSYAAGLVRTLVEDTVGTGPRLQLLTEDAALNRAVEDLWRDWAAASDFALNMRILAGVRVVAGECFGVFRDSKRLDRLGLPVPLDVRLLEPDRVAHPLSHFWPAGRGTDGIDLDADGEVEAYRVLRYHPGEFVFGGYDADRVRAEDMVHWYVPDRPDQLRGYTPLAPALGQFAQLRRFTTATLTAAEFASMLAGVMEQPANGGIPGEYDATLPANIDDLELVRGMLLTLPPGAKATQFKPEQPTTNYDMFVASKLREIGRCLNVPYGKMAGDHSRYNYSSGRMDDAPYWHGRDIERDSLRAKIFDPVLYRWCDYARFAIPRLAAFAGRWWQLRHVWHYDAKPTSDPVKDASGDELNLTNGSDTLAGIAARDGTTVGDLLDQRARELQMFEERGLPIPPWLAGAQAPVREPDNAAADRMPQEASNAR